MRAAIRINVALALASSLTCCTNSADQMAAAVGGSDASLARTAEILKKSTRQNPGVLRILFYGQSITSPAWTDASTAYLRERYPNTTIIAKNLAIGGNSADLLERATARDIDDFYPDLIVFHVFGDHRAYERIIRLFRSRTAAEVIVQTDPVRSPIEPPCPEGLNLSLNIPQGCRGYFWLRQRNWDDYMSGSFIPRIASTYRLAVDPRRTNWNNYLQRHNLNPADLLADGLHPNEVGWKLSSSLFNNYFVSAIEGVRRAKQKLVQAFPPPESDTSLYNFEGNRVELIASKQLVKEPQAYIDRRPSVDIDGCWQVSRVSPVPTIPQWPAIRQVYVDRTIHRPMEWTARIWGGNYKKRDFTFSITNKRLGPDGEGSGSSDFYSRNSELVIRQKDWAIPYAASATNKILPRTFDVSWTLSFKCRQQEAIPLSDGTFEYRYLLASGLPAGKHSLQIRIGTPDRTSIREIRVYRPPLLQ